jgi:anti-sigma B factor antagonist
VAKESQTSKEFDLTAIRPSNPIPIVSVLAYRSGPWTVLVVDGEMDLQVIPLLPDLPHSEAGRVVFDLHGVTFMDARGLGVIVGSQQKARQAGGCLRLVAPSTQVCRILILTGTDQAFRSFPTLHAAVSTPVLTAPNLAP